MLFSRLVAAPDPTVIRALLTLFQYGNWFDSIPLDAGDTKADRRVERRLVKADIDFSHLCASDRIAA
eukprot:5970929-Prymnesium_polylepis.1